MSKSIGGILVRYPNCENLDNVNKINNYPASQSLALSADYQAPSINSINLSPMTLAQGVRNSNQAEFADYDLAMQIKNLQALMPDNPVLQQQYSAALTKALAFQINAQAGITNQVQPRGQTNSLNAIKQWGNDFSDATEAGVVGYATGASLGNFDEAMGGAATAFGVDYKGVRDAVRQLQNDLSQKHPFAYGVGEFAGAMTTPMHLVKDTIFANKALNAATDTLNASAGYAENWNDFVTNLLVNGVANGIGLKVEQLPVFRAIGNNLSKWIAKNGPKFIKQGINSSADKLKNMFYNNDEYDKKSY